MKRLEVKPTYTRQKRKFQEEHLEDKENDNDEDEENKGSVMNVAKKRKLSLTDEEMLSSFQICLKRYFKMEDVSSKGTPQVSHDSFVFCCTLCKKKVSVYHRVSVKLTPIFINTNLKQHKCFSKETLD